MPQIAAYSLQDTADVTHTFSPDARIPGGVRFVDKVDGVKVGYPSLHIQTTPVPKSKLTKVRVRLNIPVLENVVGASAAGITPAPQKAFDTSVDVVFFSHDRSTSDHRGAVLHYVKQVLASTQIEAIVVQQETYV